MHRSTRLLCGAYLGAVLISCTGDHIGRHDDDRELDAFPSIEASSPLLPRLTQSQYFNALRDVFGDALVVPSRIEPDVSIEGLVAIGAAETSISARGAEQYEAAAYNVSEQVLSAGPLRDALALCQPSAIVDSECARETLARFGLRLWRRPLLKSELDRLVAVSDNAALTLGDFHQGLQYGLAALLQSPAFLFRAELADGADGADGEGGTGSKGYGAYELASRMSFFLWNTIPDLELLDLARTGELLEDEYLLAQTERMLADPKARAGVRNFFTEAYGLQALDQLSKDTVEFVHMNAELGPSAREQTLLTIEDLIFDEQADFRQLFTTSKTFINRQLAAVYNVRAPSREGFAPYFFPEDSERSGLLTQVSILAGNSHPIDSSATLRGKFVRKKLMCGIISPPPVDVNAALPEPSSEATTLRERLQAHVAEPSCAGCHITMDPIGLSLENFDALGQYRATDHGAPIDASGELDGVFFDGPRGLGQALANATEVSSCLSKTMYRYATNHIETDQEALLIRNLESRFDQQDHQVLALMRDIVMSPGFRNAAQQGAAQ